MQVGITGFRSFPLGQVSDSSQKELLLAREMFELACLLAVEDNDPSSFERHFAQVKPFYFDFTCVRFFFSPLVSLTHWGFDCMIRLSRLRRCAWMRPGSIVVSLRPTGDSCTSS